MGKTFCTYNLYGGTDSTIKYYYDLEGIAKKIDDKVKGFFKDEIREYRRFLSDNKIEKARTESEYGLELLVFGVLYQCYGKRVVGKSIFQMKVLNWVVNRRANAKRGKSFFSKIKGILSENYLTETGRDNILCKKNFNKFVYWLKATGEFKEEGLRFDFWKLYIDTLNYSEVSIFFKKIMDLSTYFKEYCGEKFNEYTSGVDDFIKKASKEHKWKEDILLVTRGEIEYKLNMIGAQILNNTYRKDFLATKKKYIFIPGCMTEKSMNECKAHKVKNGYECAHCTKNCSVNRASEIAKEHNAKILIVYHESELYKSEYKSENENVGIVGIACVLNLISGGFKAKRIGYIPQCVVLNYSGCTNHWTTNKMPTAIDESRLSKLLE